MHHHYIHKSVKTLSHILFLSASEKSDPVHQIKIYSHSLDSSKRQEEDGRFGTREQGTLRRDDCHVD